MVETTVEVVKTKDQLLADMKTAMDANDFKAVAKVSMAIAKVVAGEEKAKKDAMLAVLAKTTESVKGIFDTVAGFLTGGQPPHPDNVKALSQTLRNLTGLELEGADGIWYARDFGEKLTACRLTKAAKKASSPGTTPRVSAKGLPNANDLMPAHGDKVMFDEEAEVTINKVKSVIAAGTTFKAAHELSTDGNWRYRVLTAMRKEAGLI